MIVPVAGDLERLSMQILQEGVKASASVNWGGRLNNACLPVTNSKAVGRFSYFETLIDPLYHQRPRPSNALGNNVVCSVR